MIHLQKAKVVIAGVMLSTSLGLMVWVNSALTEPGNMKDADFRIPATSRNGQGLVYDSRGGTAEFNRLADLGERSLASLGRPAEQIDNLRFGLLEGKYALSMSEGKLQSVTFVDTPNSVGSPVRIKNRSQFIEDYSQLIGAPQAKLAFAKTEGRLIEEEYVSGHSRVRFILDDRERLLGLVVE